MINITVRDMPYLEFLLAEPNAEVVAILYKRNDEVMLEIIGRNRRTQRRLEPDNATRSV